MKEKKLTKEALASLCKALAHLLRAGIPTGDALLLLSRDEKGTPGAVLQEMSRQADRGMSLAAAVRASGYFPPYMTALLEVGEGVGKTEETLASLGNYYENRGQMSRRIRSSLLYPAALLCVLLAVVAVLLIWVLPVFNGVYAQMGSRLTGLAGWLLTFGQLLRSALPWIGGVLLAVLLLLLIPPVRRKAVALCKKMLADRGAFRRVNNARFLQGLSLGISSGMTPQEAAALAAKLADGEHPGFVRRCQACLTALEQGEALPKVLGQQDFLCASDVRLLEAGSRSGHSESVLADIAARAAQQGEEALERAAGKLEPGLVAVACTLIGLVLLSVMLPLMNIMSTIG